MLLSVVFSELKCHFAKNMKNRYETLVAELLNIFHIAF